VRKSCQRQHEDRDGANDRNKRIGHLGPLTDRGAVLPHVRSPAKGRIPTAALRLGSTGQAGRWLTPTGWTPGSIFAHPQGLVRLAAAPLGYHDGDAQSLVRSRAAASGGTASTSRIRSVLIETAQAPAIDTIDPITTIAPKSS